MLQQLIHRTSRRDGISQTIRQNGAFKRFVIDAVQALTAGINYAIGLWRQLTIGAPSRMAVPFSRW
jgi:hypothetical protein